MGSQIEVWERCQSAGPIGTKFGTRLWIHLGMDIGYKQVAPRYPRVAFGGGGVRGSTIQKIGKLVKRLDRLGINSMMNDESGNGHWLNKLAP